MPPLFLLADYSYGSKCRCAKSAVKNIIPFGVGVIVTFSGLDRFSVA